MAIFTAIASFVLGFTFLAGNAIAIGVLAIGLGIATQVGLSYAIQKLRGDQSPASSGDYFGVQTTLAAAGDVPRSFPVGKICTAGSLVYANSWGAVLESGQTQETPNAYHVQVIALSDLPGPQLLGVWFQGVKLTMVGDPMDHSDPNAPVGAYFSEFVKSPDPFLFIRYYDGTQTTADNYLVNKFGADDRPWTSTRVGTGCAYAIITALIDDTLFSGIPTDLRFELSSIPLYDPSKDDTVGGTGSQRHADPSTWGGDGDDYPAVQIYNIKRGIRYNGDWVYGLQNSGPQRVPASNWIAQIAKCRATITGEAGAEPSYRTGMQIDVSSQPINAVTELLTGCQGRVSELGGAYKLHLGAPDDPVFSFSDGDIVATETQVFRPFFALADSVNGIQGTYPEPSQGWAAIPAPALYRTDLEAKDGNRRLMANPQFNAVPYAAQVQRLQKSAIEEGQRARTHVITLPPEFRKVEPGDVGEWTSPRNGYVDKQFRVDQVIYKSNLDVTLAITEVDPSDFDWDHATEFKPVTKGPMEILRPAPQTIAAFDAEPYTMVDSSGFDRRPAIRLSWAASQPSISGVTFEVRLAADSSDVARGDVQYAPGEKIVEPLLPLTAYQVRAKLVPTWPRDVVWSDWLNVTTPDVRLSLADFQAAVTAQVTTVMDYLSDRLADVEQRFATANSRMATQQYLNTQTLANSLSLQSDNTLSRISSVETVSIGTDAALASAITTLTATVNSNTAAISSEATVRASADTALATNITALTATVAGNTAAISTNATAISTLTSSLSSYLTIASATSTYATLTGLASTNATVTTNSAAIATLNGYAAAQYSVTLDVNGYAVGFNLLNGGGGISAATFTVAKFQIASPGVTGGAAVPIFTVANVSGSPKVAIRGDMIVDGSIVAAMIAAGTITASKITAGTLTSASGVFGALSVDALSIADNAVTVAGVVNISTSAVPSSSTLGSFNLSVNSTGLSAKPITFYALAVMTIDPSAGAGTQNFSITINGSSAASMSGVDVSVVGTQVTISGLVTINGTGSTMTVPVVLSSNIVGSGHNNVVGTLYAVTAKR